MSEKIESVPAARDEYVEEVRSYPCRSHEEPRGRKRRVETQEVPSANVDATQKHLDHKVVKGNEAFNEAMIKGRSWHNCLKYEVMDQIVKESSSAVLLNTMYYKDA